MNFTYTVAAVALDVVREFDKGEDVLLSGHISEEALMAAISDRELENGVKEERLQKTYVAKVLHNVVELLSLFELLARLSQSFFAHKVFCDFRPHSVFLRFLGFESPSSITSINHHQFSGLLYDWLLVVFAAPNSIQPTTTAGLALENNVIVILTAVARTTEVVCVSVCSLQKKVKSITCDEFQSALPPQGRVNEVSGEEVVFVLVEAALAPVQTLRLLAA